MGLGRILDVLRIGKQRIARTKLHARLVLGPVRAVPRDPHVAGRHALHRAVVGIQHLGGREARIDLDAERFGLLCEPAAQVAKAADVVAVIAHERREQRGRDAIRLVLGQDEETVFGNRCRERRALRLPVGDQLGERARIDDGAGKDVGADLGSLLEDAHRYVA